MLMNAAHLGFDLFLNYGPNFHFHLQVGAWVPAAVLIALWKNGGPPGTGSGGPLTAQHRNQYQNH